MIQIEDFVLPRGKLKAWESPKREKDLHLPLMEDPLVRTPEKLEAAAPAGENPKDFSTQRMPYRGGSVAVGGTASHRLH